MFKPYDNFFKKVLISVFFETPVKKGKMGSSSTIIIQVNDQIHILYPTGVYLKYN